MRTQYEIDDMIDTQFVIFRKKAENSGLGYICNLFDVNMVKMIDLYKLMELPKDEIIDCINTLLAESDPTFFSYDPLKLKKIHELVLDMFLEFAHFLDN